MADIYDQIPGGMTSAVGANARRTLADESRFGTPDLTLLIIDINNDEETSVYFTDGEGGESAASEYNSTLFKTLQALQTRCEIYKVGQVDDVQVGVFVRGSSVPLTGNEELEDGNTNSLLSSELSTALDVDVNVWHAELDGNDIDYD